MSDTVRWTSGQPRRQESRGGGGDGANLADILERVLDKGIVIAGDIQVNLLDIELLTIKIRLVVASVDRAKEMGIDWWERDPTLSAGRAELEDENAELRARIAALEEAMGGRAELVDGAETDDGAPDRPEDAADDPEPEDAADDDPEPDDAEAGDLQPDDDEPGDDESGDLEPGDRPGDDRDGGSRGEPDAEHDPPARRRRGEPARRRPTDRKPADERAEPRRGRPRER